MTRGARGAYWQPGGRPHAGRFSGIVGALLAGLVAVAGGTAPADAANPRGVTLATQNIYQGTELEHVLRARNVNELLQGVATDYTNVINTDFAARTDALAVEIAASSARSLAGRAA
jgi:hypothetical protein